MLMQQTAKVRWPLDYCFRSFCCWLIEPNDGMTDWSRAAFPTLAENKSQATYKGTGGSKFRNKMANIVRNVLGE